MVMNQAKKYLAVLIAILVPMAAFTATAQAAGESAAVSAKITPRGGKFFKKKRVASNLSVAATITPGSSSATVLPTKNIKFTFPAGMGLNPNRNVCPNSKLGPNSNLSLGPKWAVQQCPKAVVGTGTAMIYLAKIKASPLRDPVLIAFNAGKNGKGQAKLKIYGYSKQTTVGILMNGVLKGRVLSLNVPVLSSDSAVGDFRLQMPGPVLKRPDLGLNVKGLNPRYVLGSCAHSPLITSAVFTLGERNVSTGKPTGPTSKVNARKSVQKCVGKRG